MVRVGKRGWWGGRLKLDGGIQAAELTEIAVFVHISGTWPRSSKFLPETIKPIYGQISPAIDFRPCWPTMFAMQTRALFCVLFLAAPTLLAQQPPTQQRQVNIKALNLYAPIQVTAVLDLGNSYTVPRGPIKS